MSPVTTKKKTSRITCPYCARKYVAMTPKSHTMYPHTNPKTGEPCPRKGPAAT